MSVLPSKCSSCFLSHSFECESFVVSIVLAINRTEITFVGNKCSAGFYRSGIDMSMHRPGRHWTTCSDHSEYELAQISKCWIVFEIQSQYFSFQKKKKNIHNPLVIAQKAKNTIILITHRATRQLKFERVNPKKKWFITKSEKKKNQSTANRLLLKMNDKQWAFAQGIRQHHVLFSSAMTYTIQIQLVLQPSSSTLLIIVIVYMKKKKYLPPTDTFSFNWLRKIYNNESISNIFNLAK